MARSSRRKHQASKSDDLRFGDFNADKRTDVFGVVSNAWRVSYSAVSSWEFLRSKLSDTVDTLHIADFDGNGTDDVATRQPAERRALFVRRRVQVAGVARRPVRMGDPAETDD